MTAVFNTFVGLCGIYLFLAAKPGAAYLCCALGTQIWRFLSEFLRADYRGEGQVSVYQWMALFAAVTSVGYFLMILPAGPLQANIVQGLQILSNPAIILLCLILWFAIFLYMGSSRVTAAHISFYVRSDRI